jgi:hypothetical protein
MKMAMSVLRHLRFPRKEGGIQVLAVLASSQQKVGSLKRTPPHPLSAKSNLSEFTSIEKYSQTL